MKGGKAVGMDGIVVKVLKNGSISIVDWLLKIFNKCMESDVAPEDWKAECMSLYAEEKGIGEIVLIIEEYVY